MARNLVGFPQMNSERKPIELMGRFYRSAGLSKIVPGLDYSSAKPTVGARSRRELNYLAVEDGRGDERCRWCIA
jgi:hypothetical protein